MPHHSIYFFSNNETNKKRECLAKSSATFGSILDLDKIRCYFKENG
ncbi:hypothetical protein B4140_2751 [Bacillus amyloliquefaciens]|nr:hypothetical protein B4140_2751 [Bacillus amyloliquefaciens]